MHCGSSASFALHIPVTPPPAFYCGHLLVCFSFLKLLWTPREQGLISPIFLIPSAYNHACYLPETWDTSVHVFELYITPFQVEFFPDCYNNDTNRKHSGILWTPVALCEWLMVSFSPYLQFSRPSGTHILCRPLSSLTFQNWILKHLLFMGFSFLSFLALSSPGLYNPSLVFETPNRTNFPGFRSDFWKCENPAPRYGLPFIFHPLIHFIIRPWGLKVKGFANLRPSTPTVLEPWRWTLNCFCILMCTSHTSVLVPYSSLRI